MKVCVIQPVLDSFKGANHLPLFASLHDMEVVILCNRSKVPENELPPNITVETLPGKLGSYYYGISDYRFAKLVLAAHPTHDSFWRRFSVIHLNQVMGPAFTLLPECGVPVLYAIHHPVTADEKIAVEESNIFQALLWKLKYFFLKRWQKKLCFALPAIMTVSATAKKRIMQDYSLASTKISIVPNGVDGDIFTPGAAQTDYDVIAVGSFLHPRKGFPYLLSVYRALAEKGRRIVDIGRRSDEQLKALRSVPGVVTFGTIPHEKLVELLQKSSVLISTSLYEGFGLSLIEALSCGRPAFAFDVGAVFEVLGKIDKNLVVPARDTKEMVRRIQGFLNLPPQEQAEHRKYYREKVLSIYSLQDSAKALRDLYFTLKKHA